MASSCCRRAAPARPSKSRACPSAPTDPANTFCQHCSPWNADRIICVASGDPCYGLFLVGACALGPAQCQPASAPVPARSVDSCQCPAFRPPPPAPPPAIGPEPGLQALRRLPERGSAAAERVLQRGAVLRWQWASAGPKHPRPSYIPAGRRPGHHAPHRRKHLSSARTIRDQALPRCGARHHVHARHRRAGRALDGLLRLPPHAVTARKSPWCIRPLLLSRITAPRPTARLRTARCPPPRWCISRALLSPATRTWAASRNDTPRWWWSLCRVLAARWITSPPGCWRTALSSATPPAPCGAAVELGANCQAAGCCTVAAQGGHPAAECRFPPDVLPPSACVVPA